MNLRKLKTWEWQEQHGAGHHLNGRYGKTIKKYSLRSEKRWHPARYHHRPPYGRLKSHAMRVFKDLI